MELYKVANVTKKILIGVLVILSILLVTRIIVSIVENLSDTLVTKYSIETRGFGTLPPLTFKRLSESEGHMPAFRIETPTGSLDSYETLLNVYRKEQPVADLSSDMFANSLASSLGFFQTPKKLTSVDWVWEELDKSLEMNIQTRHFKYTNISTEIAEEANTNEDPSRLLESMLRELGYFDLPDTAEYVAEYLNMIDGEYVLTKDTEAPWVRISLTWYLDSGFANMARVSSPYYIPGTTYLIIRNVESASIEHISELAFAIWTADTENVQTYYGISVDDAYTALSEQMGGILVYADYARKDGTPNVNQISEVRITSAELGYYSPEANILYLQPIYIFYGSSGEGQDRIDLVYYVPAII